jgi:Flp pilus assembly protein TadG
MGLVKRFSDDHGANVAVIFALAALPIISVVGMGIDYTLAGRREVRLNAAADAAALSTTTPSAMGLTPSVAQTNAQAMFNAQAGNVGGIGSISSVNVTVTDTAVGSGKTRNTTVTYSATSINAFSSMLHMATMTIGGTSKVSNTTAPNIDFYMLLDTSPSMAIPSSQAGINTMVQNTSAQGGCAFACHETNPTGSDNAGNPGGTDNYQLARNLGVTLRIDLIKQAAANLISTAQTTQAINKAQYRVATYTFDANFTTITNLTTNLTQAQADATSKIQMLTVYNDNGYLTQNNNNNDEDTQLDQALSNTQYMPNPGNGTSAAGDTPQEVLFLVTDGVIDEAYPNVGPTNNTNGGRTITTIGHQYDYCTPLKARGVRIAVLYTTYNPLPTNGFYNTYVAPFQPNIPTAMQACASPGLFFQVDTGGDIVGAMQTLFSKAVASAHLTQ